MPEDEKIELTILKHDYDSSTARNLLEYLEHKKVDIHYHCRDGFCGACRTKLVAGNICYQKEPLAFIRNGDFLPCCSTPASEITIQTKKQN